MNPNAIAIKPVIWKKILINIIKTFSPRRTNPSNDCIASYVFPDLDHDNDSKTFPENPYKRPALFHAKVVSIGKMGFHLFQKTKYC